jgi:hypothetical protein
VVGWGKFQRMKLEDLKQIAVETRIENEGGRVGKNKVPAGTDKH